MDIPQADDSQPGQHQRPDYIRSQWWLLGAALGIFCIILGYQHYRSYQAITRQEEQRLLTQSHVIRLNMERQLQAANQALQDIVRDKRAIIVGTDTTRAVRRLKALSDALPGIRTMLIFNADGTVLASSREEFVGRSFSSRDYYQVPLQQNDAAVLYVSPPFKSVLGPTILNLSRVIPAPDGAFGGVVVAALDPEYFGVLLKSVRYAEDMTCAITHGDGLRFMLVPEKPALTGKNQAAPGSFLLRHRSSGKLENILRGRSVSTGEENLMVVQTVNPAELRMNKPLYIFVSHRIEAVYGEWYRQLAGSALFLMLLSSAAVIGLQLLQRRQQQLEFQAVQMQEVMALRLSLMEYAATHTMHELLQQALDEVCQLCGSPIGFYHFVEADQQTLSLQAWSTRTLAEFCRTEGHGLHYPLEQAGVWADCVRQRKVIIHNDYGTLPNRKGLPEGHAMLVRELVVPIFRADKVVAILGVGNKQSDYSGQDVELVSYLADVVWEIAGRKRSEEERHRLGLRYQTLQAVSSDGIHIINQEGRLVESNAAFRKMLGYGEQEELQLSIKDWDAGMQPEELAVMAKRLLHGSAVFETKHRRRDGTVFDVEVSVSGVELDDGCYLYASSRDISKRKELEQTLEESRQLQADIFDFLPDATFVIDLEKRVIAWNRAMEEMSGVPKQEMLGQGDHAYTIPFYGERRSQLLDLIDLDDEELQSKYKGVTRIGTHLYAETFCPALYGGKGAHVWAIVAPLYDTDGRRIGAIESIRDITAIKDIEANLARSNQELEQFAYVASHDLQEPLRKIAGFTELLANRYKGELDDKADSYMGYIVDGATRMRTLINDLLSYSRVMRSTKELADTDCSEVFSKVLKDMEIAVKESNAEISCGPLPVVRGDQVQLGQLFQNLIGNAIKYRGVGAPRIEVTAVRQQGDWLFSVRDNGIGIAPEFFERIFAIFQRLHTRTEYPGTGIGLAVCQKIVERHGGRIWLESSVGNGSTFFFTIPAYPGRQEKSA